MRLCQHRLVSLAAGLCALVSPALAQVEPQNVQMANAAWAAFEGKLYEGAIVAADDCILTFEQQANAQQQYLHSQNIPVYNPRQIVSEAEKQEIFSNGTLNDVSACLFVKLASSVQMSVEDDALCAIYLKINELPHALIWDPQGWFWSAQEAAIGELAKAGLDHNTCIEN